MSSVFFMDLKTEKTQFKQTLFVFILNCFFELKIKQKILLIYFEFASFSIVLSNLKF